MNRKWMLGGAVMVIILAGFLFNDANTSTQPSALTVGEQVKVDQVGYLPDSPKLAMVTGGQGNTFDLKRTDTNAVVLSRTLTPPLQDANPGDKVQTADFSAWTEEGTYVVEVKGAGASYPFKIAAEVYRQPLIQIARTYTLQRSNVPLDDDRPSP